MSTPRFLDAAGAAEMLHVPQETILAWVQGGKLRTYGGRANNPFVVTAEVASLAAELGLGGDEEERPRRTKSASARVQARLTADSRWSAISADDIREWSEHLDAERRQAALRVTAVALERLQDVQRALHESTD